MKTVSWLVGLFKEECKKHKWHNGQLPVTGSKDGQEVKLNSVCQNAVQMIRRPSQTEANNLECQEFIKQQLAKIEMYYHYIHHYGHYADCVCVAVGSNHYGGHFLPLFSNSSGIWCSWPRFWPTLSHRVTAVAVLVIIVLATNQQH